MEENKKFRLVSSKKTRYLLPNILTLAGVCLGISSIKFSIDGKEYLAEPSESIWDVAKKNNIDIPHLCYSPEPGYRADGNCRACMVEIKGERTLAASCIRKPTEGMEVTVNSPRAEKSRSMVFELLVSDQPSKEQSPDPDSKFWNWSEKMGVSTSRFPGKEKINLDKCKKLWNDIYKPAHTLEAAKCSKCFRYYWDIEKYLFESNIPTKDIFYQVYNPKKGVGSLVCKICDPSAFK